MRLNWVNVLKMPGLARALWGNSRYLPRVRLEEVVIWAFVMV